MLEHESKQETIEVETECPKCRETITVPMPQASRLAEISCTDWVECVARGCERTANALVKRDGVNSDEVKKALSLALAILADNIRAESRTHSTEKLTYSGPSAGASPQNEVGGKT